jgi:hypothetical protein
MRQTFMSFTVNFGLTLPEARSGLEGSSGIRSSTVSFRCVFAPTAPHHTIRSVLSFRRSSEAFAFASRYY